MKGIIGQTGYGWMRPDGSVFACPSYEHIARLAEDPHTPAGVTDWYQAIILLEKQEQADRREFSASLDRGDVSGWHEYDNDVYSKVSHQHYRLADRQAWMGHTKYNCWQIPTMAVCSKTRVPGSL